MSGLLKAGRPSQTDGAKARLLAQLEEEDKTVRLNLNLSAATHKNLRRLALETDTTVSDLVRQLIDERLAKASVKGK